MHKFIVTSGNVVTQRSPRRVEFPYQHGVELGKKYLAEYVAAGGTKLTKGHYVKDGMLWVLHRHVLGKKQYYYIPFRGIDN